MYLVTANEVARMHRNNLRQEISTASSLGRTQETNKARNLLGLNDHTIIAKLGSVECSNCGSSILPQISIANVTVCSDCLVLALSMMEGSKYVN